MTDGVRWGYGGVQYYFACYVTCGSTAVVNYEFVSPALWWSHNPPMSHILKCFEEQDEVDPRSALLRCTQVTLALEFMEDIQSDSHRPPLCFVGSVGGAAVFSLFFRLDIIIPVSAPPPPFCARLSGSLYQLNQVGDLLGRIEGLQYGWGQEWEGIFSL